MIQLYIVIYLAVSFVYVVNLTSALTFKNNNCACILIIFHIYIVIFDLAVHVFGDDHLIMRVPGTF